METGRACGATQSGGPAGLVAAGAAGREALPRVYTSSAWIGLCGIGHDRIRQRALPFPQRQRRRAPSCGASTTWPRALRL